MDKFFHKESLIGIRIRVFETGTLPITDEDQPLQILTINQQKNTIIKPHRHRLTPRSTTHLQECLIVKKGRIKIDLYGSDTTFTETVTVEAGQAFITISGGHAIEFLEDSEVFEIKNGPFINDKQPI